VVDKMVFLDAWVKRFEFEGESERKQKGSPDLRKCGRHGLPLS